MLYDTIMVDTCHYTFVKAHRMYKTKSESYGKLWTLDYCDVNICSTAGTNVQLWWGVLVVGETIHM